MNAAFAAALLLAASAVPALAQQQYPSDSPPSAAQPPALEDQLDQQQAQTPQEQPAQPGEIERLKQDHMSSPNVTGENVPESTTTGLPEPQNEGDRRDPESVPRP